MTVGTTAPITPTSQHDPSETLIYKGVYGARGISGIGAPGTKYEVSQPVSIDDPDHLHSEGALIYRVSPPGARDAICDETNSSHTLATYAFLRGRAAIEIDRSFAEAACWFHAGAIQKNGRSASLLGLLYAQGLGVKRSYKKAFTWSRQGALQRDPFGELALSLLYANGLGVKRDAVIAAKWRARGNADFDRTLDPARTKFVEQRISDLFTLVGGLGLGGCTTYHDEDGIADTRCTAPDPAQQDAAAGAITRLFGLP